MLDGFFEQGLPAPSGNELVFVQPDADMAGFETPRQPTRCRLVFAVVREKDVEFGHRSLSRVFLVVARKSARHAAAPR